MHWFVFVAKDPSPKRHLQTKRITHREFENHKKTYEEKNRFRKSKGDAKREAFISICPSTRVGIRTWGLNEIQYFNVIHIPFDVKVNENGFSLNY